MLFNLNTLLILSTVIATIRCHNYYKRDLDIKKHHKGSVNKWRTLLAMQSMDSRLPVLNGFRAESTKQPIVIDDTGLTVIPDKTVITLRLFGNHLMAKPAGTGKLMIGFTALKGQTGDPCDPYNEFAVHKVVDDSQALVRISLSETIRDDPYYLCYGTAQAATGVAIDGPQQSTRSLKQLLGLTQVPAVKYTYLSDSDALKLRVIGRSLAAGYGASDGHRDANVKMKLAQILDEVNKIHRLTDEMQDWRV